MSMTNNTEYVTPTHIQMAVIRSNTCFSSRFIAHVGNNQPYKGYCDVFIIFMGINEMQTARTTCIEHLSSCLVSCFTFIHALASICPLDMGCGLWHPRFHYARSAGSKSRAVIPSSFMNIRTEGPATSLSGSPTVSPTMLAL